MVTKFQELGSFGELVVVRECSCPRCKRARSLVRLPPNFKCADVICDFCGFLAQVKTVTVRDTTKVPRTILGAAWGPQKARMDAAIYFPLFLVLTSDAKRLYGIYYLSSDLQRPEIFKPRTPLSSTARRAGWQGFYYDTQTVRDAFVRVK